MIQRCFCDHHKTIDLPIAVSYPAEPSLKIVRGRLNKLSTGTRVYSLTRARRMGTMKKTRLYFKTFLTCNAHVIQLSVENTGYAKE